MFEKIRRIIIGPPRNPLNPVTRKHIALIAFLAWIGLGADGLSSSCYGPEEAFMALGPHTSLALFLAIAIALTVFIISLSYNQVIELFPNGGGGYKVATQLLNPYAGLVSGAALIVDYVLTIAISVASGVDALFSLLPLALHPYKISTEIVLIFILMLLNLRGIKESIKILMPIFIGFVLTHFVLIIYGIFSHGSELPIIIHRTMTETHELSLTVGLMSTIALLLRAYSLGGGTYTGLEAVSNNVNTLAEPRVTTGKWTMFYMATSLSFTAAGIMLLYLLWHVSHVPGQTLNAVVFGEILGHGTYSHTGLIIILLFEAGLLFVGANTGFLGGPAVLANMALDSWVPNRFRNLSNRLVTQNGIILFGLAALLILIWSHGQVGYLVVLYSVDVFLTFSISLIGLCRYWLTHRELDSWLRRFLLSLVGAIVCLSILTITLVSKFKSGGWFVVLITGGVVAICLLIKKHYNDTAALLKKADELFSNVVSNVSECLPPREVSSLDPSKPTAVFFVSKSRGAAIHTILWAQRLFPNHFKNFVFVRVGVVDVENFSRDQVLEEMQHDVEEELQYLVNFAKQHGIPSTCYRDYGTDPVSKLTTLAKTISEEFPNSIFFACNLIFTNDNWIRRLLHNDTATSLQRQLHLADIQMILLPMKLSDI